MNDIIEPKTELEVWRAWKSDFTSRMVMKSPNSVRINVSSPFNCWVCRKEFIALPYESYCSVGCMDEGDNQADMWRDE